MHRSPRRFLTLRALLILGSSLTLSLPAHAQSTKAQSKGTALSAAQMKRVQTVVAKLKTEWRVYLTCSRVIPGEKTPGQTHTIVRKWWTDGLKEAGAALRKDGATAAQIATLMQGTDGKALSQPALKGAAYTRFCNADKGWLKRLQQMQVTVIVPEVEAAVRGK